MERMKRAVSLLLCFVMVFGLLPMTVLAEGEPVSDTGSLVGGTVYTLDTDGVDANGEYLIVSASSGTGYALTNNNGSASSTAVTISGNTITVEDDSNIAWTFSGSTSGTIYNGDTYIRLGNNNSVLGDTRDVSISSQGNGAYQISYKSSGSGGGNGGNGGTTYYLRYSNGSWSRNSGASNVYLYKEAGTSDGSTVEFTVTPGSTSIAPGGTVALTGTVTVGSESVNLSDCTIIWASTNEEVATVVDGTVTGVGEGSANITATLSAVDGTALQDNIVLTIPVTVASKTLDPSFTPVLSGNDVITIDKGVTPDFSGIRLVVKFNGDDETTIITVENGLDIEDYDIETIGTYDATISYLGKEYGTVRIIVEGNPYAGKDEATTYPEYPADGAVRIDKTATELEFDTTGVVQVELDVAGVSVKKGVDAVLTIDISNSMAWETGTTDDNFTSNKLTEVMTAINSFAKIFLAPNEDGTENTNTITIVTFAGYDAENWNGSGTYIDSVRTLVTGTSSLEVIEKITSGTKFLSKSTDYQIQIAYIPASKDQNDASNVTTESGANRGDTNYDYAFWQSNQAIKDGNLGGDGRDVYVLLMSDGCASNYNDIYYRTNNVGYYYLPGTKTQYTGRSSSSGTDWTDYILNTLIANNGGNKYAVELYEKLTGMYAVGFDMQHGSFSGISSWDSSVDWEGKFIEILSKSVTDSKGNGLIEVTNANEQGKIQKFYETMATALRYAGTQAQVTDTIDSDFTLQMSSTSGTAGEGIDEVNIAQMGYTPSITIKAYDLWTKSETDDTSLIGTRKTDEDGSYIFTEIETVTFNDSGTEAYSSKIDDDENIMTIGGDGSVTINAYYFTYTKTAEGVETFSWNIGNITDKEITLSYMAYLKGSLEGTESNGLKYTNEEATLEYIDINDCHATQTFPVPAVAWGGASTAYEFYLVNEDGKPCDRTGAEVPFANRIIITGPYYEELYLNQDEEEYAKQIIAAYVLPAGYTLYDETAYYEVQTASGDNVGSLTISDPASGKAQTTIVVSAVTPSYIQSRVAFGVLYNEIPTEVNFELTPDAVVIDYGKPIVINIANGNDDLEEGYTAELVGFNKYYENVNLRTKFSSTSSTDLYKATYGTFTIENNGSDGTESTVRYTPTSIVNGVEDIFCVIKMYNEERKDTYYMVDHLTVIPATMVYYETNFSDSVFTYDSTWNTVEDELDGTGDEFQSAVEIGKDRYGYDKSYTTDAKFSEGESYKALGQGYSSNQNEDGSYTYTAKTYTTFSFKGTGFDLISRTGAEQGLIKVEVFSDEAMTTAEKTVSVLNKSESNLELYQIPVVSINDLTYGTHYVRVSVDAGYTNNTGILALDSLNRGNEFYFDAIRIYDPVQGNSVAEAAYVEDGEANMTLHEIRAMLLDAGTFDSEASPEDEGYEPGVVFVDRNPDNGVEISDYTTIGPNNEVYLTGDQAIGFKLTWNGDAPASIDLGIKSADGNAVKPYVEVWVGEETVYPFGEDGDFEIESATVQFYDLLDSNYSLLNNINEIYVLVSNDSDDVMSVTDLKVAYGESASSVSVVSDEETVEKAIYSVQRKIDAEAAASQVNYDVLGAYFTTDSAKRNQMLTMVVTTTENVESITVQNSAGKEQTITATVESVSDGVKTWTVTFKVNATGTKTFTVTGYGANGNSGATVQASIKLTR